MTAASIDLVPVRGKARIEVLDILRGIAILGIFYMNIPFMSGPVWAEQHDLRSIGWSAADRIGWSIIQIFMDGTQRGLLELLFGAGMMVLTAKAMEPDGPVAVADLYTRRNLWLLAFGLADIFLMLWPGDILHIYALAALFLFPFRKLGPKLLLGIGLLYASYLAIGFDQGGAMEYVARTELVHTVDMAKEKQGKGVTLTAAEKDALQTWQKKLDRWKVDKDTQARIDAEKKARNGSFVDFARWSWSAWLTITAKGALFWGILEAFFTMLIGIALWKWGIIQGLRSARFYAVMAICTYGFGLTARAMAVSEILAFMPYPKTLWITFEYARLAVSLGHVALINLLVRTSVGKAILSPFKAAGQTAFSLYFMEQFIGIFVLFSPLMFHMWGRNGWAGLYAIASGVILFLLVIANIWVRYFTYGPLEWLWRSLSYCKRQPFLKVRAASFETAS